MNYGEELLYWYLRLNGFFPISNFVIHRTAETEYPSDCDVLAVRPPYVYEEIGGKPEDWDDDLFVEFDADRIIGVICEVKTGAYELDKLFRRRYVKPSVQRLGFTADVNTCLDDLEHNRITTINEKYQIGKLFISNTAPANQDNFLYFHLNHIREFLTDRIKKYPERKYGDRMFFSSNYIQELIDRTKFEVDRQNRAN